MAVITLDRSRLKHNYQFLNELFQSHHIEWAIVSKMLCGNRLFLEELLEFDVQQLCDSRVSNLEQIKELDPTVETFYIRPPSQQNLKEVVQYADYSINSELHTLESLSQEALSQGRVHKVMISLELGELREGVMGEELIGFYRKAFQLPGIEIEGIAANLSCLYGVLPSADKLIQLSLYAQLIEAKFGKKLKYISGGSSVTLPLLMNGTLPKGINHFRVGETLFFGTNVYDGTLIEGMEHNVFQLFVNVVEVMEKPMLPTGEFGTNLEGESYVRDESLEGKTSIRAIIDIGVLDVDVSQLTFIDPDLKVVGATSDLIVLDLGENRKGYSVGDQLGVSLNYMSTLKLINSKYIEKKVIG